MKYMEVEKIKIQLENLLDYLYMHLGLMRYDGVRQKKKITGSSSHKDVAIIIFKGLEKPVTNSHSLSHRIMMPQIQAKPDNINIILLYL